MNSKKRAKVKDARRVSGKRMIRARVRSIVAFIMTLAVLSMFSTGQAFEAIAMQYTEIAKYDESVEQTEVRLESANVIDEDADIDNELDGSDEDSEPGEDGELGEDSESGEDGGLGEDSEPGEDGGLGEDSEPGEDGGLGEDSEPGEDGELGEDNKPGEDGELGEDNKPDEDGKLGEDSKPDEDSEPGEDDEPNDGADQLTEEMPLLSGDEIRQMLVDAIFADGYAYGDTQAQEAVKSFVLFDMEDDFARLVLGWIMENDTVEKQHWVEYLLQAMDYQYQLDESYIPEGPGLTDEEADIFLKNIGMKPVGEAENGLGIMASNALSFYNANGSFGEWDSVVYAEDIAENSLIRNFYKSAKPVDELFRTYEITLGFEVGEAQHLIPGQSEPADVVLVIDKTGSMTSGVSYDNGVTVTRMEAVKAISKTLVKQIMEVNPENKVSVVSFNETAKTDIGLTSRGESDNEYKAYTGNISSTTYRSVAGFQLSSHPQLYYMDSMGEYIPVKANAKVVPYLIFFSQYEKASSGGTHFVPEYEGLNTGSSTKFYVETGGYIGISQVWDCIDRISASGNTDIQSGIRAGYNVLSQGGGGKKQIMILLTDGEANRKSDTVWDRVNIRTGITSSAYEKAAMLEGQWTVEQGVDLYATGFSVNSEALRRTTWSLSESGMDYRGIPRQTVASGGLGSQHPGYERGERYFTTNTASGLEEIFAKIGDEIINIGAVSNVTLMDVLSKSVMNHFGISGLADGIDFTGTLKNSQTVSPAFTAEYGEDTGALNINVQEPLATGIYTVSFIITALPGEYAKAGSGISIETNESAGIVYEYLDYLDGSPVNGWQSYSIDTSPVIDVPPLIIPVLADNGIAYAGTEYTLKASLDIPEVINMPGNYRIPDEWIYIYNGDVISSNAVFRLNGEELEDFISGSDIHITVEAGMTEYIFTGDCRVSENNYPVIYGDAAPVRVIGAEGRIIYSLTGVDGGAEHKDVAKGLFDIMTRYGDGKQFHTGLEPGESREYSVRENLGALSATTIVPYGYTKSIIVKGGARIGNDTLISLSAAINAAADTHENALEILKNGSAEQLKSLEDSINTFLTVHVNAEVKKPNSPWFRDWAWKRKDGVYDSEVSPQ